MWDFGGKFESSRLNELKAQGIHPAVGARWDVKKPYLSFWQAFRRIRELARQYPPDIVHSHSEFGDILALFLKFLSPSLRIIRTVHYGYRVEWRRRPLRRLLLTHISYPIFFKLEIGVAPWIAYGLNRRPLARLLSREAVYIPNAIDSERFHRQAGDPEDKKASLSIPPGIPLIGTVGRLTRQKGYRYLVEAVPAVAQKIRGVRFLIIGQGEDLPLLENLAKKLGVADRVIFLGPRRDVEELLPCLDLFVSPSLWEGLPTVLMEAMAAGVPIVGTNIPGTADLIQHGKTGWLVPAGDGQALAAGLVTLMENPRLRQRLAAAAHKNLALFALPEVAVQYAQRYREILSEPF